MMGIGVVQSCESALSYYYKAAKKGSVYVSVDVFVMIGTKSYAHSKREIK
jgi:hypothetical protein